MNITNDLVTEYINSYYRPQNEYLQGLRKYGENNGVPIILKETESCLRMIVGQIKPKKILEIGTAIGYSSLFFASTNKNCQVFSIEKDEKMYEIAKTNVETCGMTDTIHLFLGDGEEVINDLNKTDNNGFDMVFIDAAKSHYRRFFDSSLNICNFNATIISDNILMKAMTVSSNYDMYNKHKTNIRKMREYVEYISQNPRFDTCLLSIGDGLAITKVKESNE